MLSMPKIDPRLRQYRVSVIWSDDADSLGGTVYVIDAPNEWQACRVARNVTEIRIIDERMRVQIEDVFPIYDVAL